MNSKKYREKNISFALFFTTSILVKLPTKNHMEENVGIKN